LAANVLEYGNWFSARLLCLLGIGAVIFVGLSFVFLAALIGAVLFIVIFAYYAYARYRFSPRGGDLQAQVPAVVLDHLDWDGQGQAIDIGCGNAPLTIEVANGSLVLTSQESTTGAAHYRKRIRGLRHRRSRVERGRSPQT